jgi:hypothetical protein
MTNPKLLTGPHMNPKKSKYLGPNVFLCGEFLPFCEKGPPALIKFFLSEKGPKFTRIFFNSKKC